MVLEMSQMDKVANSLKNLSNESPTSNTLRDFLRELANVGYYLALRNHESQHFKRSNDLILNDIIQEQEIDYANES